MRKSNSVQWGQTNFMDGFISANCPKHTSVSSISVFIFNFLSSNFKSFFLQTFHIHINIQFQEADSKVISKGG